MTDVRNPSGASYSQGTGISISGGAIALSSGTIDRTLNPTIQGTAKFGTRLTVKDEAGNTVARRHRVTLYRTNTAGGAPNTTNGAGLAITDGVLLFTVTAGCCLEALTNEDGTLNITFSGPGTGEFHYIYVILGSARCVDAHQSM